MSVLPGSLYDQYDFGPLHAIDHMAVFADLSRKQPRGVVKDVVIQLGDFYYSVDFIVIYYAPSRTYEQPQVVLGRPFLYTANAQIDCRNGMVTMSYENRKLYFNVFLKSISYDLIEKFSHTDATNESVALVNKDMSDANGVELYRSRADRNGNQVKRATVRGRAIEGKPPDGGSEWGNKAEVELN